MPTSEAQRTLVKSPPELWAELSDPNSLGRHLGELGDVRITRVEPEQTVEWEARNIGSAMQMKGTAQIKPAGWGTKVTLTVTRETPAPETATDPEAESDPETEAEAESEAESDPEAEAEAEAAETEAESEPKPEPEPRLGFFARLFRRRRTEQPAAEATPPREEAPGIASEKTPVDTTLEKAPADIAAELARVEEAMIEQDAALLSAVLDRLGAAHHRPFSRT